MSRPTAYTQIWSIASRPLGDPLSYSGRSRSDCDARHTRADVMLLHFSHRLESGHSVRSFVAPLDALTRNGAVGVDQRHRLIQKLHMHHDSFSIADLSCACNALRKASRAVTRFYDEVMEDTGLSLAQFAVLWNIARREPIPLMDLAHLLVMDRTTLYRALKPLEREGWVTLEDGQGRAKTVRLTDKGHHAVKNSTDAWQAAQRQLVEKFGLERWAATEAALQDLVTISQEAMQ